MSKYEGYSNEELESVLANPKATRKLKMAIRQELNSRSEKAATPGQGSAAQVDPLTGQPTGGAPQWMQNLVPSITQFGDSLTTGVANLATAPIDTLSNIIPGMASHYNERYLTPEPGQPFYSDAVNTFNQDPFGAAMDLVPVGTGMRLAGAASKVPSISAVGRGLERMDPVTMAMGGAQTIAAPLLNRSTDPRSAMAGTDYGMPRGAQRENLGEYLNTVDRALEQNLPPTVEGAAASTARRQGAGAALGEYLDRLDASGTVYQKADIIKELMNLQDEAGSSAQAPYRNAVDKMIADLTSNDVPTISPREVQKLKETYAGLVNYNSATPAVDPLVQQGYSDSSKVLRERLRADPVGGNLFDDFGRASAVEDIVTRGAANDVTRSGAGVGGDYVGQLLGAVAPLVTGQNKFERMRVRNAARRGEPLTAFARATERTPYGPLREGAYVADKQAYLEEDQRWHVGRLWED